MPQSMVHIVAVLLLAVQGLLAHAPARVLCIPTSGCETHTAGHDDSWCGHSHGAPAHAGSDGQSTASVAACDEPLDCGCHVHVPIPDGHQVAPLSASRSDAPEWRAVFVPAVVWVALAWKPTPRAPVRVHVDPPDPSGSMQSRGLRSTRLLI